MPLRDFNPSSQTKLVRRSGCALALRYVAEIVLGPSGGALAQRYGPRRVLTLLSISNSSGARGYRGGSTMDRRDPGGPP